MEKVSRWGLCCGCGTCAGICPTKAIEMRVDRGRYVPKIQGEKCIACHLCVQSCPGHSVDLSGTSSDIVSRQKVSRLLGNYLDCYVGHSTDSKIRYDSSSGGLVTQFLIYALENNIIDGALVTRMKGRSSLEPEVLIAKTRDEIVAASKSKYCPVAANVGLAGILQEEGRFAVVGLPCHIHGVRKAEKVVKALKKKIVLHIGLLCSHSVVFDGTDFLLDKLHIKKEHLRGICYRGEGWPGSLSVRVSDGSSVILPYAGGWNAYGPVFSSFFVPMRCTMCPDLANELSDVSFGDAWFPELKKEKFGDSIIITRSKVAEEVLLHMSSAKAVYIKRIEAGKVEQSQASELRFKKDDLKTRLSIMRLFGKNTPILLPESNIPISTIGLLRSFLQYGSIKTSSNARLRPLLTSVPLPLFRIHSGIRKFLYRL